MTDRELSKKLCKLACELNELSEGNQSNSEYQRKLTQIADELHELSNEKFSPGSTSWSELKKQADKPSGKPKYVNQQGREMPF